MAARRLQDAGDLWVVVEASDCRAVFRAAAVAISRAISGQREDESGRHVTSLNHRLARRDDLDAIRAVMNAAISELQKPFLDQSQIASSRAIM